MKKRFCPVLCLLLGIAGFDSIAFADTTAGSIERGQYLTLISGCHDCHTPLYGERAGDVPESDWFVGLPIGFQGPWGTSYPANLRLTVNRLDQSQFIARSRSEMLPPMPWLSTKAMTDEDLASIYVYIKSLGPAGVPVPAYVGPGVAPTTPFIVFVPQDPPQASPVAK